MMVVHPAPDCEGRVHTPPNHLRCLLHPIATDLLTRRPPNRSTDLTVSRPTLRIIRHDQRQPPGDVSFEIWNPITASYESMASLDACLFRLEELAEFVWQMWLRNEPAQASLKDAPDPAEAIPGGRSFGSTLWPSGCTRPANSISTNGHGR
jgi:hypothetical protein